MHDDVAGPSVVIETGLEAIHAHAVAVGPRVCFCGSQQAHIALVGSVSVAHGVQKAVVVAVRPATVGGVLVEEQRRLFKVDDPHPFFTAVQLIIDDGDGGACRQTLTKCSFECIECPLEHEGAKSSRLEFVAADLAG